MKKIIKILLVCLFIAGIIVIATIGFNVGTKYSENTQIGINIGKEFDINDIKAITDEVFGNQRALIQKVEMYQDMVQINVEEASEEQIADLNTKINEKFGVSIVRFKYKPRGMALSRYTLDEEQRKAYIFYDYYGEMIRYSIYMNDADSSFGQKDLDLLLDEYQIDNNGQIIYIEEYKVEDSQPNRYIAEFKYKDAQYQLMGVMKKTEFDKIIKNLIFL